MHLLDNVVIWRGFRWFLDAAFGLYRERFAVMREFGVAPTSSVLDVGCGTGECSVITEGRYLGIDMDVRYIAQAQRRHGGPNRTFVCADVASARLADESFDVGLLVDVLHHLTDDEVERLCQEFNRVVTQAIVVCDPVRQRPTNLLGRLLTYLDRGAHIRTKERLVELLGRHAVVERIRDLKLLRVESVCVLARPRR